MNSKTELKTEPEAEVKADSGTDSKAGFKTASGAGGRRRRLLKAGAWTAFVFFLGLLLELFCNLSLFQNEKEGNFPIPLSEVEYEAFGWIRGSASS